MEVVLTPAAPSRAELAQLIGDAPQVLVTPVDGGALVVRAAQDGDPRPHRPAVIDGALVERVGAAERAIVFGAGHVGCALGPLLAGLGFTVVVCDDDETGALTSLGGSSDWAHDVVVDSFDAPDVEAAIGGWRADDYVLIVTRDHAIDQRLLEDLIGRDDVGYLGMIGSRGKGRAAFTSG